MHAQFNEPKIWHEGSHQQEFIIWNACTMHTQINEPWIYSHTKHFISNKFNACKIHVQIYEH